MRLAASMLFVAACCAALPGCSRNDPPPAETSKETTGKAVQSPSQPGATVRGRIHPSLPEFQFTLVPDATAAPGELRIERIAIRAEGAAEPLQVISGVDAEPPAVPGQQPLELLDMNFDGYADLRIVEFAAAGPNTPYRNWLYDPASQRFVASPELDAIPSARFDATRREIESDWRDGPTHYGTDVYRWLDGKLVAVRKEERTYHAPGVYTLKRSELVDGTWKTVEEREVREVKGS